MIIKAKLSEKDYISATLATVMARKGLMVYLVIIFFVSLFSAIGSIAMGKADMSDFILPLIFIIVLPSLFYFSVKKAYANNKRAGETIEYWFEPDMLKMKGESFSAEQTWDKIHKVTLTKNWLLIWQNKQVANAIPRRDVWDGEMQKLKDILTRHKVKNNLS